jgi:hypothetical protein
MRGVYFHQHRKIKSFPFDPLVNALDNLVQFSVNPSYQFPDKLLPILNGDVNKDYFSGLGEFAL